MALDFAAMLAAARAEARRQRAGDAASDGTDAPAATAAAAPARSEEAEAQEVAAYLLRALKEGLGAPAVAAGWRDWPATAVPSAFVLEDFVSEAEEAELLELIEAAPRSRWTQLRARSLQNWGGHPRAEGMVLEPLPVFLQQLIRRLQPLELFGGAQANHVLINKYLAGQGIMPHKDGPLYYPTVAIISLGSSATMDFFETLADSKAGKPLTSLFLRRRSLLIFKDRLYRDVFHSIGEHAVDEVTPSVSNAAACGLELGARIPRGTRISLTIRRVPERAAQ